MPVTDRCREEFEKAGYWPNDVMWKAWQLAWKLGAETTPEAVANEAPLAWAVFVHDDPLGFDYFVFPDEEKALAAARQNPNSIPVPLYRAPALARPEAVLHDDLLLRLRVWMAAMETARDDASPFLRGEFKKWIEQIDAARSSPAAAQPPQCAACKQLMVYECQFCRDDPEL